MEPINYKQDLDGVDWEQVKARVVEDDFDNGRTAWQLRDSFENSYATVFAYAGDAIVGKARALSDGICNAYIVDVWTYSPYRKRGIATEMMRLLAARLSGQHIYLFTEEETVLFYEKLGFKRQGVGLGRVEGKWLQPGAR